MSDLKGIYDLVINSGASRIRALGRDRSSLRENVNTDLGGQAGDIYLVEGPALLSKVSSWLDKYGGNNERRLIIGGGDGSVRSSVGLFTSSLVPMGVVALGFLNQFATSIGYPLDPHEGLKAIARGVVEDRVDVGYLGDRPFLATVSFDPLSYHSIRARDIRRETGRILNPEFIQAAGKTFLSAFSPNSEMEISSSDGKQIISGKALLVTNGSFASQTEARAQVAHSGLAHTNLSFLRISPPKSGSMSVYGIGDDNIIRSITNFGRMMLTGHFHCASEWQASNSVSIIPSLKEFEIRPIHRNGVRSEQTHVMADAETIPEIVYPIRMQIHPEALNVLRPKTV